MSLHEEICKMAACWHGNPESQSDIADAIIVKVLEHYKWTPNDKITDAVNEARQRERTKTIEVVLAAVAQIDVMRHAGISWIDEAKVIEAIKGATDD